MAACLKMFNHALTNCTNSGIFRRRLVVTTTMDDDHEVIPTGERSH